MLRRVNPWNPLLKKTATNSTKKSPLSELKGEPHGHALAGPEVWAADAAQESRIHTRSRCHACPGYRSEHGDLQRDPRRVAQAPRLPRAGPHRHDSARWPEPGGPGGLSGLARAESEFR